MSTVTKELIPEQPKPNCLIYSMVRNGDPLTVDVADDEKRKAVHETNRASMLAICMIF